MLKVLVPVDGSSNSLHAVRHVLSEFRRNPAIDIHLLNVQPPYSRYVTRFVDRTVIKASHAEASEKVMQPIRPLFDAAGVPCVVHFGVGDKATEIVETARQLRCGQIVIGTARKSALVRTIEGSVTTRVLELATMPVVAIPGDPASKAERYGIPAGVSVGLTWLAWLAWPAAAGAG